MANLIQDRLKNEILLFDSAMGTMLFEYGHAMDTCLDELNLSHPEQVAEIHRANIQAGADIIETNTFGANRFRLEEHDLQDKVRDINFRGVKIAREEREISGRPVLVAGSIGPTGRTLKPFGQLEQADAQAAFAAQVEALLEAGVDLFVIETMSDPNEVEAAIAAVRGASDLPIVSMLTFNADSSTITGESPAKVVNRFADSGVVAIGANCSVGPQKLLQTVRQLNRSIQDVDGDRPAIAAMPNAGFPNIVKGRVAYPSTPDYFAQFARDAVDAGARLIGGCCGTTPRHVAAMRTAINDLNGDATAATRREPTTRASRIVFEEDTIPDTPFRQAIGKRFLTAVEIDPPKGFNPTKAIEGAKLLKEVGVDAINVADSPMARVRMSAMTLCYLIQHEVGIETIIHFTTRDRSLMGLQSELLGAHAAGVRNILALTGDPPSLGDYQGSTPVYDVDSIGLVRIIARMNQGEDTSGASLGKNANFTIACAVDPTKPDQEDEARRLKEKIAGGAHFVMTQPIFDADVWTNFLKVYGEEKLPIPVMIGILPLQSSRHAEFLHNEVPGITLTDAARERMRLAGKDGRKEGIAMAQELLLQLQPQAEGVYLMPSFGRYEVAAEVISILGSEATASAT